MKLKPIDLDALPVRAGGPDQLHSHMTIGFVEGCGACAQLANDFTWAGFHDSVNRADWAHAQQS